MSALTEKAGLGRLRPPQFVQLLCVCGGGGGEGWREPPQLPGNGEGSMGKAWELKLEEAVYVIHNEGILAAYFLYLDVTGMFACWVFLEQYCTSMGADYCTDMGADYCTDMGADYCTAMGADYCTDMGAD